MTLEVYYGASKKLINLQSTQYQSKYCNELFLPLETKDRSDRSRDAARCDADCLRQFIYFDKWDLPWSRSVARAPRDQQTRPHGPSRSFGGLRPLFGQQRVVKGLGLGSLFSPRVVTGMVRETSVLVFGCSDSPKETSERRLLFLVIG